MDTHIYGNSYFTWWNIYASKGCYLVTAPSPHSKELVAQPSRQEVDVSTSSYTHTKFASYEMDMNDKMIKNFLITFYFSQKLAASNETAELTKLPSPLCPTLKSIDPFFSLHCHLTTLPYSPTEKLSHQTYSKRPTSLM